MSTVGNLSKSSNATKRHNGNGRQEYVDLSSSGPVFITPLVDISLCRPVKQNPRSSAGVWIFVIFFFKEKKITLNIVSSSLSRISNSNLLTVLC